MSEADYLNEIRQLVELQKVDDEIFEVNQELENAPRKLEELERTFKTVEGRRNHVLDKLDHLKEQKKRISLEIDDDSARIKKSKSKLMQVGNTREYQAVMREMDSMEKNNRTREEEKNTLLEELRNQTEQLAQVDVEYEKVKDDLEARRASLDDTLMEAKDKLRKLSNSRNDVGKDISRPIFQRYEFIRNRLEHPVIVSVVDGICSGCHIAIPPQSFIELQSGQQILSCPNCQRLIFWSEHFEPTMERSESKRHKEKKPLNQTEPEEDSEVAELEEFSLDDGPERDAEWRDDDQL